MSVQTWECYVISIGRKYFWARMRDLDHSGDRDGKFYIDHVTEADRNVFKVGALFILRLSARGKLSLKFSHRRWTKAELAESNVRAKRLWQALTKS